MPDPIFDFDKIFSRLEKLKADYSTNPHIVQMVGEDHGYIVEVYFYTNSQHREFFWIKHPESFEMAVQLIHEIAIIHCKNCNWERIADVFIAQQFLKKVRFNNIPHIISAATLDRPILPKNKITEFVSYELSRHFREKHSGVHEGNHSPQNKQEDTNSELPEEHSTNNQPPQGSAED